MLLHYCYKSILLLHFFYQVFDLIENMVFMSFYEQWRNMPQLGIFGIKLQAMVEKIIPAGLHGVGSSKTEHSACDA